MTAKRATTGWPVEMPPRMPPAWLDRKRGAPSLPDAHLVGVLLAGERRGREAGADLDALDGVDPHQRRRRGRRRACRRSARPRPGGTPSATTSITAPIEEPALRTLVEIALRRTAAASASGQKNGLRGDLVPVPAARSIACGPICTSAPRIVTPGEDLARDGAGRDARRGLARRRAPAAAIVADAVLDVVGVVGVAGPVLVRDLGIVLRALVDVLDQERDRRAGGDLPAGRSSAKTPERILDLVRLAGAAW